MKQFFTFIVIMIISTTLHAKNIKHSNQVTDFQQTLRIEKDSITKTNRTAAHPQNEANNLKLWLTLDKNKDNFISKTEAICAQKIIDRWDELDSNKDNRLDFFDFSRLSNQKT